MPEVRYSFRCVNPDCRRYNRKTHSTRGNVATCRHCGLVQPGPGMKQAMDFIMAPQPTRTPAKKNGNGAIPTTTVKVAGGTPKPVAPAKPKTEPKPVIPISEPPSRSWLQKVAFG